MTVPIASKGQRDDTANPCVGVCSTGLGDEICRGCGRSFHEVSHWAYYTPEEKRNINVRIRLERAKAERFTTTTDLEW